MAICLDSGLHGPSSNLFHGQQFLTVPEYSDSILASRMGLPLEFSCRQYTRLEHRSSPAMGPAGLQGRVLLSLASSS